MNFRYFVISLYPPRFKLGFVSLLMVTENMTYISCFTSFGFLPLRQLPSHCNYANYVIHNGCTICPLFERRFVPQAAPQARKLLPQAAPQARMLCRTTGKRVFAAPQARSFLPYHSQEGFCRTTGKRAFAAHQARWLQRANNILAAPD